MRTSGSSTASGIVSLSLWNGHWLQCGERTRGNMRKWRAWGCHSNPIAVGMKVGWWGWRVIDDQGSSLGWVERVPNNSRRHLMEGGFGERMVNFILNMFWIWMGCFFCFSSKSPSTSSRPPHCHTSVVSEIIWSPLPPLSFLSLSLFLQGSSHVCPPGQLLLILRTSHDGCIPN